MRKVPSIYELADEAVASSEQLQASVRGEVPLLFPPGGSAFLAVVGTSLAGWIAQVIPIVSMHAADFAPETYPFLHVASMGLVTGAVCIPGFVVVHGFRSGHKIICRWHRTQVVLATVGLIGSTFVAPQAEIVLRTAGLTLWAATDHMTRGASYSLLAAFFRAKREFASELERSRSRTLHGQRLRRRGSSKHRP